MQTRSEKPFGLVVTGASGGLGAALVGEYAAPGVRMLLLGRNAERLGIAADLAARHGAEAETVACSARDRDTVARAIRDFEEQHPIDLVILAAGTKTGNYHGSEPTARLDEVIDTNLAFPAFVVQCVLSGMRRRGTGRIALVSSLAALAPHPDLLSYSASKAGLSAYGTALRRALSGSGIGVSIVTAGFIDTPMTGNHIGPTPMLVSAEHAAARIRKGLERGRLHIGFPIALVILTRLWNLLPLALGDRIAQFYRARILDPELGKDAPELQDSAADFRTDTTRSI